MNKLVKDLKNSFLKSLNETADVLNVSSECKNKVFVSLYDRINTIFKDLDGICTEYGKGLLLCPSKEENNPEDLTVIFSGKNGGKVYCTSNPSDPVIINDEFLVTRDLKALNDSFYREDYIQASKLTKLMKEKGIITLKEYKK